MKKFHSSSLNSWGSLLVLQHLFSLKWTRNLWKSSFPIQTDKNTYTQYEAQKWVNRTKVEPNLDQHVLPSQNHNKDPKPSHMSVHAAPTLLSSAYSMCRPSSSFHRSPTYPDLELICISPAHVNRYQSKRFHHARLLHPVIVRLVGGSCDLFESPCSFLQVGRCN